MVKQRKIGFISAILITVGASIGSGFFFKSNQVLTNAGFSLPLSIFAWVISGLAVVAMALALIEVTATSKANNLSLIEWVKKFCHQYVYKACKNFMYYIYLPLTFFAIPLYALNALQDALVGFGLPNHFNTNHDFVYWTLLGLLLTIWFLFTSGLNAKWFNIQNWVITSVKFLPLLMVFSISIYVLTTNQTPNNPPAAIPQPDELSALTFSSLSPGVGIFISFAAIFFAYDGFYCSHGLQIEMANPKKTSYALFIGLLLSTLVYLVLAILLTVAKPDSARVASFATDLANVNLGWLFGVLNLGIFISVLGILNAFAMWATRVTEDLLALGLLPFANRLQSNLNPTKPRVGAIYFFVLMLLVNFLFTLLGGLGYLATTPYFDMQTNQSLYDGPGFNSMAKILSFADLMANWTSLGAFAFIMLAILGCQKKLVTNKQKPTQIKFFHWVATFTILVVGSGLLFTTIAPFVDVIFLFTSPLLLNDQTQMVPRILTLVVFAIYGVTLFWPNYFDAKPKPLKVSS